MFGFVIGTVCLLGLIGLMRASFHHHHFAHGYGPHGRGGWGGRGWGGRGWEGGRRGRSGFERGFAQAAGEVVKRRLRIDEDQEGIVDHALTDLRETGKEYVEVLEDARKDLAAAFAGEAVDEAAIASVFARHDEELAKARRDAVSALKQIHSVLDPDQRKAATDWLGAAEPGRWV
jgi:hypothetical protein